MTKVFQGERVFLSPVVRPIERGVYRLGGVREEREQRWTSYLLAVMLFTLVGIVISYLILRLQSHLPLNPDHQAPVSGYLSFNTSISFATNTNWQNYGGETTMSYLTQMVGLTVQNFVSAAVGMAVLVALIRGFARRTTEGIGNFWVDLTRTTLYILLPLSLVFALVLVSQGVVQTFGPYARVTTMATLTEQVIAVGPAASQIAIKQLGTNGGGFFNANSAHPLENPTPLSNFLELLAILLIPAALCYTFGVMVKDTRQGWTVLAAMTVIFVGLLAVCVVAEQGGAPFARQGVDHTPSALQSGGNMEGKEVRFGIASSALWATATTAASNGSVNAMHDSFTPIGGLVPLWMIELGEVVYGGVGSGLYGMLVYAIVAVFVAGLMVGRTPEYLGKKIEAYEMKMSSLVILIVPGLVLLGTSVGVATAAGRAGPLNPGPHGFSEILYAFSSAGNNNGSAFGGISANTPFYNVALGLCMLFGRYWLALPVLAIAGSLARKKIVPTGPGTLPTHTPLFVALLVGVVILVGALTYVPALALGPIVEHLNMIAAG